MSCLTVYRLRVLALALALGGSSLEAVIASLGAGKNLAGKIARVELLGHRGTLEFTQDTTGLHVTFPASKPAKLDHAYALKVTGLKLTP